MYDCSKIKRLTVLYKSKGPGTYAGDQRKILTGEDVLSICQEANRRDISIEMLLKEREPIEAVVINTIIPFEHPVSDEIQESAKKAKAEETAKEQKNTPPAPSGSDKKSEESKPEPAKTPESPSDDAKPAQKTEAEPEVKPDSLKK